MSTAYRFGRRVPLPSTKQILHELRMFIAADEIKALEQELLALTKSAPAAAVAPAKGSVR